MAFTKIAAAGIGSTELVTLHSLEVLNNATVGGVLTYEDVTNVDSIGIVTARAGVLVGSGITLSKDGDIFATGVTTSTTFSGNFSGGTVSGTTGIVTTLTATGLTVDSGTTNTCATFKSSDTGAVINLTDSAARSSIEQNDTALKIIADTDASDADSKIQFQVDASTKATIDSSGNVMFGTTSNTVYDDSSGSGVVIRGATGAVDIMRDDDICLLLNRNTGDGQMLRLARSGVAKADLSLRSDALCLDTAGSERARIDSSGNFMIGATSASGILHVEHSGENNTYIVGNTSDSGARLILQNKNTTANSYTGVLGADAGGQTTAQILFYSADNDNNEGYLTLGTRPSGGIPTERLRILSDGKVGINIATPRCLLDLGLGTDDSSVSNTAADYQLGLHAAQSTGGDIGRNIAFISQTVGTVCAAINTIDAGGSDQTALAFYTGTNSAITEKMRIQADGKVSMGNPASASPNRLLYVDTGTTGDGMRILSDEVMGDFVVNNTGDGHGRAFVINASRVDSGSYPKLHLAGQGSITFAVDANSTRMTIDSSGNIGAPSGNNIYNASDERLKENMIDLTNGLDKINKLKPVSFTWKNGWSESLDGVTQYGFGAQTTQSVDELLVEPFSTGDVELNGETIENPLRVNEKHIIPLLVKAIQELSAKVAALEG